MRVTHVITRLIVGGAQENTLASVLGLREKPDLRVDLISGPTTGPEGSLESGIASIPGALTILPELVRPIRPLSDLRGYLKLRRIFRTQGPDLVHTHSGKAGVLGRLAARAAGVPLVIHTIHGPSFGPFQGTLANLAFTNAERFAGRFTDHFVVVADAMAAQYRAAGIGREDQFTRIFSGFGLEPYLQARRDPELAQKLGISPDDLVVGKIARLFELKGHDDLFAAAPGLIARCPRIKFLLVGDGPWRSRFEAMAQAPGLRGRFVFAGLVTPAEVPRYVALMDVLVHLSSREGLPRALPQAMAGGKPVVAYDCDGAREACLDGETGFLVPLGNHGRLVEALVRLAENAALREQLGRRGREFARERFSVQRMVDELHALYRRLAAARSLGQPAPRQC